VNAAITNDEREVRQRESVSESAYRSNNLILQNRPLDAEIESITGEFDRQIESARGSENANYRNDLIKQRDSAIAVTTKNFNFETDQIDLSQQTQRKQLEALYADPRDTVGAGIIGETGRTDAQVNEFLKEGRPQQALNALDNQRLEFETEKRQYLSDFGFTGVDPRYTDTQLQNDTVDPGKVLEEFQKALDDNADKTATAIAAAISSLVFS
jgi:hypothetical protein